MNRSSTELKNYARKSLSGHYPLLIGAFLLSLGIQLMIILAMEFLIPTYNQIGILTYQLIMLIVSLLFFILDTGFRKMILNLSRDKETNLSDLFSCFGIQPDRIILLNLASFALCLICLLPAGLFLILFLLTKNPFFIAIAILLGLAGLVLIYILRCSLAPAIYLHLDDPEKGVTTLIRESFMLMKGKRLHFFYINLSFFGLLLLSVLTCYVGFLWVLPYMEMTQACFYRDLIGELE